jgi:hypothetical protein
MLRDSSRVEHQIGRAVSCTPIGELHTEQLAIMNLDCGGYLRQSTTKPNTAEHLAGPSDNSVSSIASTVLKTRPQTLFHPEALAR